MYPKTPSADTPWNSRARLLLQHFLLWVEMVTVTSLPLWIASFPGGNISLARQPFAAEAAHEKRWQLLGKLPAARQQVLHYGYTIVSTSKPMLLAPLFLKVYFYYLKLCAHVWIHACRWCHHQRQRHWVSWNWSYPCLWVGAWSGSWQLNFDTLKE